MQTALIIAEIIVSLVLIVVALMQSGKEAGLSSAVSGNNDSYMGRNKKSGLDKMLTAATKWIALVWVLVTFGLVLVLNA